MIDRASTSPPGFIPLCVPHLGGNEAKYVQECVETGWVSSVGPFVDRFEQEFAAKIGAVGAVATSSGTAALHVALLLAGVRPDEEVLVSDLTFIAPANAVRYVGAWPVFVDADPATWQFDVHRVVAWLEHACRWDGRSLWNRASGRRVAALLPVHILGHPVDLDPLLEAAKKFGLPVIEDATESLGATYKGRAVGTLGDIGCFSFNGNKLLTTGGGGMLVARDRAALARAKYLTTQAKDDPLEYVHGAIGFNYRLTNLQAALGVAQLERLDQHVAAKRAIAERYRLGLGGTEGLTFPSEAPWARSAFWMYTLLVEGPRFGTDSRGLLRGLEARRIQARPLWQPLHQSPAHRGGPVAACPVAEGLHRDALSLPCSVGLSREDQHRVMAAIADMRNPPRDAQVREVRA